MLGDLRSANARAETAHEEAEEAKAAAEEKDAVLGQAAAAKVCSHSGGTDFPLSALCVASACQNQLTACAVLSRLQEALEHELAALRAAAEAASTQADADKGDLARQLVRARNCQQHALKCHRVTLQCRPSTAARRPLRLPLTPPVVPPFPLCPPRPACSRSWTPTRRAWGRPRPTRPRPSAPPRRRRSSDRAASWCATSRRTPRPTTASTSRSRRRRRPRRRRGVWVGSEGGGMSHGLLRLPTACMPVLAPSTPLLPLTATPCPSLLACQLAGELDALKAERDQVQGEASKAGEAHAAAASTIQVRSRAACHRA
jgi:hypothetical protein